MTIIEITLFVLLVLNILGFLFKKKPIQYVYTGPKESETNDKWKRVTEHWKLNMSMDAMNVWVEGLLDEIARKKGAGLIMNGDWFDCNRCGAIINKSKAECLGGGEDISSICHVYGSLCLSCYNALKEILNKSKVR